MRPCPLCAHERVAMLFTKAGHPFHRCRACGLVTRGGPREEETYHDYFPSLTHRLPDLTRRRYEEILERFTSYRSTGRTTGRYLDVGCGGGFLVEVANALGWRGEGTEVSRAAAEFGHDRGTTIHVGTLEEVDLEEGAYDVVTLMEVVEHVEDPVELLRQAGRLLRPGGALYLTTPNWGSFSRRFLGKRWFPIGAEHLVYFTPESIRRAVDQAGLTHRRTETANVQPHEILSRMKPTAATGSTPSCMSRTMSVREEIEASPWLRRAKNAVNLILRLTGTGETLRTTAERPT